MYGQRQKTAAYKEMEVLSATPEQLVPLLYEHLLVSLKRGALHIRRGDIEGKFESLGKAADIVAELLSALDLEAGGDLATQLVSLYGFWIKEIREAGRTMDALRIERVAEMAADLHESWVTAAQEVASQRKGQPAAAGANVP